MSVRRPLGLSGPARLIAVVSSAALVVALAIAVPVIYSAQHAPHHAAPKPVVMGSYPVSAYAQQAHSVSGALSSALSRDVKLTPAQYLADGAAATQAVKVVAALKAKGVDVLGSSISGTQLSVNVASSAEFAAVKAVGGKPVLGAPTKPKLPARTIHTADQTYPVPVPNNGNVEVLGGDPWVFNDAAGDGFECSTGFNGFTSTGVREFVTAGHCTTQVSGEIGWADSNGPSDNPSVTSNCCSVTDGALVPGAEQFGQGMDYGVISDATSITPGALAGWGAGGTTNSDPGTLYPGENNNPLYVTGESAAITGAPLCKSGSTSGWTCGVIVDVDYDAPVEDDSGATHDVNTVVATTCVLPGDSGGGAVSGQTAIGLTSASDFPASADDGPGYPCGNADPDGDPADSDNFSFFFPMVSNNGTQSVQGQLGNKWHIETGVQTPVTTNVSQYPQPATVVNSSFVVQGTLANPTPTSEVSLYLTTNPKNVPWATVSAASGHWSMPLSGGLPDTFGAMTLFAFDGYNTSRIGNVNVSMQTSCSPPPNGGVQFKSIRDAGGGDFDCDGVADIMARDSAGNFWLYPGDVSTIDPGLKARKSLAVGWQGMTSIIPVNDFNGDGFGDVVTRDGSGTLWLYPGNGTGFGARVQLATGWGGMIAIQGAGDMNNDGHMDIVARNAAGVVFLYPGTGTGLGSPIQLATGWQSMTAIIGVGDFNGDGIADLMARDASGTLWLYPGTIAGTLGTRVQVGTGWAGFTITAAGTFGEGGYGYDAPGLIARDSNGTLWLYPGNGSNGFNARRQISTGWSSYTLAGDASTIPAILPPVPASLSGGVGDLNSDGNADVVVRDSTGSLWLYPGNGSNALTARTSLGASSTWASMTALVPVGDFTGDGKADLIGRDKSGNLLLFAGTGSSGLGTGTQIGANTTWAGMTSIQGVADMTGDGKPDVVARDSAGNLWLYPNNGTGSGFGTATKIGNASEWATMTGILGAGDWNLDGKADIVARDASGTLWLYPGNGNGTLGSRIQLGTGWQGLSIISVGDFNKDGAEDILIRDGNGTLFLYPGSQSGGFLPRVQLGTGWSGLTLVGDSAPIAAVSIPKPAIPAYLSGGVGDFNGDGNPDVVMRDGNGALWLYPGNGLNAVTARTSLGSASTWGSMTALVPVGDFTGDGHPDLIGRDRSGNLELFTGDGASGLSQGTQIGANTTWAGMTSIQGVGDLNGDHKPDVVARDTAGNLWFYPNNGSGNGFGTATKIGDASVWGSMSGILGAGDWNLDGKADLVARDSSGVLWLYPGIGDGTLDTRVQLGTGWQGLTIISVGDFNGDGTEDILIRDTVGSLYLYPGNGSGGFSPRVLLGTGWQGLTLAGSSDSIAAVPIPRAPIPADISGGVGDFNTDGNPDVITRDGNGALWIYPGNGSNGLLTRRAIIGGQNWGGMTALVPVGDFSGDGRPDLMGRDANGTLSLYPGNGGSGIQSAVPMGSFATMTAIQGVGDMTGDGKPDVIMRDSVGTLWLYPNNGSGTGFGTPVQIGAAGSWQSFTGFLGAGDWNLDGKADLVARDSSGVLWLYPGNGNGTLGTPVQLGTGWQGITVIAVGDFNLDGTEDILIRDANGVLFLYPGNGSGFSPRIQLGTGWQGLTMAGNMDTIAAVH